MTVEFALFISPEGIALAHRQTAGHWALITEVRLDEGDLDAAMATLRGAIAARDAAATARVLVVLPDDQVLYTSVTAPSDDADAVADRITSALEGVTPYAVADLVFDWRAVDIDRVKVAVVAQETLAEATGFIAAHGFETAGFAAMPPAERFPGMPVFGTAPADLGLDGMGMAFGADAWVAPTALALDPVQSSASQAETEAEAEAEAEAGAEAEAKAEGDETAKADGAPKAKAKAEDGVTASEETAAPVADPVISPAISPADPAPPGDAGLAAAPPEAQPEAPAARAPADPEADPEDSTAAQPAAADAKAAPVAGEPELAPITDPTLSQPIAPLPPEDAGAEDAAQPPAPPSPKDAETTNSADPAAADLAPPELDPKPEPAQPHLDLDLPQPDAPKADAKAEKPAAPSATRGKVAGGARAFLRDQAGGDEPPARPTAAQEVTAPDQGNTGASPPSDRPDTDGETDTDTDADTDATRSAPALGFSARRGKAARPESGAGEIVSSRRSRFGPGAATPTAPAASLHPDTASARAAGTKPAGAPAAQAASLAQNLAKPAGKLAAQLARVREASKARAPAATGDGSGRALPEGRGAGQGSDTGGRVPADARARTVPPPADTAAELQPGTDDGVLTRGLLARKPVEQMGPSFRTGLILTMILLVLLAMIAVWSALFLPDSPMARLFSGGADRDTAALNDAGTDPGPLVVTAPPAIGERDTGAAAPPDTGPIAAAPPPAEAPVAEPEPTPPATPATPAAPAAAEQIAAVLPDIDADLDLPPLDPLPQDLLPSLEETERIYAEDGIWLRPPERPDLTPLDSTQDLYVASIDPEVPAIDAIALSDPAINPDEILRRVPPPPPFGTAFDRDARGLVTPTPEGVLTPEGAFVVLGRPPVDAQPRPRALAPLPETPAQTPADAAPDTTIEDAILGTFTPQPRPADLEETRQRQVQGGFSDSELAGLRPDQRPASAQDAAAQASLFRQADTGDDPASQDGTAAGVEASNLAVAASRLPTARPGTIAALVAAAEATPAATAPEQVARAPDIPSSADVTRAATETNAIRLRDINLIGVTGTPSDRRALVRLPSGRFVRVGVGDRLDGGRVAAIGEGSLQYVRNGRNVTLEIPG